jgi:hypothetical protein
MYVTFGGVAAVLSPLPTTSPSKGLDLIPDSVSALQGETHQRREAPSTGVSQWSH